MQTGSPGRRVESLITLGEGVVTPLWGARLRAVAAVVFNVLGRFEEALDSAERAAVDGARLGDRMAIGWALLARSLAEADFHQDQAAGKATLEQASSVLGDDPGAPDLRLLLLANRATAEYNLGHGAEAVRILGLALAVAERAGTPLRLASLRVQSAELSYLEGRWDDALVEMDAAAGLPPHNPTRIMLRGLGALIAVHRDRPHHDADLPARRGDPGRASSLADNLLVARALAAERDGEPERALAGLIDLADPGSTRQFERLSPDMCFWLMDTIRIALAVGDRSFAEAAARACAAEAQRQPLPSTLAAADCCRGLVAADTDLILAAADAFAQLGLAIFPGERFGERRRDPGGTGERRRPRRLYRRGGDLRQP
jgi:tetratricopeptide (TPR) repeat protein